MRICQECSKQASDDSKICRNCGAILEEVLVENGSAMASPFAEPSQVRGKEDEENLGRKACRWCGSAKMMWGVSVCDQGQASDGRLKVVVLGTPSALIFKDRLFGELKADICGDCGHVDLRVVNPNELYRHYRRSLGYKEPAGAEVANAVEAFGRGETAPEGKPNDPGWEEEVVLLLEQGQKIQAIRVYRKRTGVGLKEAKDAVEAIAAKRYILTPSGSGCLGVLVLILAIFFVAVAIAEDRTTKVSDATTDENGLLRHEIESPFQAGRTEAKVLLPKRLEPGKRYPVVYVLPVEAGNENRFGNGLLEVKRHDLHNRHRAVFVTPTFSHLPWYADHPTNPQIRQETYFLKVVVPLVEKQYPVHTTAGGRFLLGFSKSGWGAFTLLLRHPELFGKAAAWDAPLMKDNPGQFGMESVFGTQENFEKYQFTRLLGQRAAQLQQHNRLFLIGYGNFRQHHQQTHDLMKKHGIPHEYRDGPERKHDWHGGWMEEAVGLLFQTQSAPDHQ